MGEALAVTGLRRRLGVRGGVTDLTLRLAEGELHALVGPNGSGKTTALRMLSGLLPCDGGDGEVLGIDLRRQPRRVAALIGYMSQRLALHAELTVQETLRFRARIYSVANGGRRISALIDRFGLGPWRNVRVSHLSGGWARRTQLAATLVHEPRLVLLDEPAIGLDHEAQRQLWREIQDLSNTGATLLVSTHDPFEAERCQRISIVHLGRLVASGAPTALTRASGLVAVVLEGASAPIFAWLADTPWRSAAEAWGPHVRCILPEAQAQNLEAAAHSAGWAPRRQELRLEHAWPTFLASPSRSR